MDIRDPLTMSALLATGGTCAMTTWTIIGFFIGARQDAKALDSMDRRRVTAIREQQKTYRYCEPLVLELARLNQSLSSTKDVKQLALNLSVARSEIPWHPYEFLAVKQTESLLLGLFLFVVLLTFVAVPVAAGISLFFVLISYRLAVGSVSSRASLRRSGFVRRLPFAVDVMSLLLQAGTNFDEALRVVAEEEKSNSLGDEFRRLRHQLDSSRSRHSALQAMSERVEDENTDNLVTAIVKGEELGTPMAAILRTQADQMRLQRSQWGEKAAKEAEVKMTGPNLLIMLACIIVILGPILLPVFSGDGVGF